MKKHYELRVVAVAMVMLHSTAQAQQTFPRRSPTPPYWSNGSGHYGAYSSPEDVCAEATTRYALSQSLIYWSQTSYKGRCLRNLNEVGYPIDYVFYGQECPPNYSMKNSVDWLGHGVYYGGSLSYGPNQFCQSSTPYVDRWHDKPQSSCQPSGGNPIFPLTGNKRQSEELLRWSPNASPLSVHYDNRRKLPNGDPQGAFALAAADSFGGLWESNLHKRMAIQQSGNPAYQHVMASRGAGVWVSFRRGGVTYSADTDINDRLLALNSGWRYTDAGAQAQEIYNSQGVLTNVSYARGGSLTYSYSDTTTPTSVAPATGLLIKVQDHHGRVLRFEYEQPAGSTAPRIARIVGPDERVVLVDYDAASNLARLGWPDTKVRRFVYEQSGLPWALTGIVDENDERYSTYVYGAEGHAQSTEYAGGVNRYSLSYSSSPRWVTTETYDFSFSVLWRDHNWQAPQDATLTTPNGTTVSFGATLINGMPRVTTRSQPAGAGCDASSSSLTYDANGNIASKTDFNGVKSCHAYDLTRNLETVRVEGLDATAECGPVLRDGAPLPATSRKTVTRWHPDWQLPTAVAGPKKLTTYVYNGQPDPFSGNAIANCVPAGVALPDGKPLSVLCRRVEQVTADVAGHRGFALDAQPATAADIAFPSISSLLHLDGTNGSTVIADRGPAAHRWTTTGAAAISTRQSRFGKASLAPGGGAAQSAELNDFLFGDGDFTVEAWVYKTSSPREAAIVALWGPNQCSWFMGSNASNQLSLYTSSMGCSGNSWPAAGTIPINAWTHVAVSRSGSSLLFFINGAQVGAAPISGSLFASSGINVTVGAWVQGSLSDPWPGYIDEVRVTKGVARYTAAFNAPTAPFSDSVEGTPALPSMIDVSVPSQVVAYTYNQHGQMLTARDALNKLTTYSYYGDTTAEHTKGDLQSVTDAAGRVTQYTRYDRSGRLQQSIDPNGTVTDTTYTPRGWVKTVTVTAPGAAAQASLYDYDGVGQLKKATLPDGSALGYTYDAAHRLTSVKDAAGNSVTYTLDNMGNRTGEDLKDPSGTLARNITRVYDALNRVESTQETAQ